MPLYAIHNLSSSAAFEVQPWNYKVVVPDSVKKDKNRFMEWCKKPTTKNCHFSAAEGLDPHRRVSTDNPIIHLHALVADYDAEVDKDMIKRLIEHSPTEFVPNWGSLTFNSGGRLVWLFSDPLTIPDREIAKIFLKMVARKMKLTKLLPGFDYDAFIDPSRYYERGREWMVLSGDPIPKNFIYQWMYEAGNKYKWRGDGLNIPLPEVYEEVKKKFPGRWEGPFEDGMRGVRFWDPDADNNTAAVIREGGIQCFTGNEGYLTWANILGPAFIRKYEANRTGEIIAHMYYDGKAYWKQNSFGEWHSLNKDDFALSLRVRYNLHKRTSHKESCSEIDRVTFAVQDQQLVKAAMPFVHFPSGPFTHSNTKFLNTSNAKCMEPNPEKITRWGDKFPWLAEFLEGFFEPREQLEYFLSWWKYFYSNGLRQAPKTGQAIFIVGETGIGKTLLSTGIISKTVGGHIDASSYLLGEEKFTSHIVAMPIMTVDDTAPATDNKRHSRYSAMIKKMSANRYQLYEEKFQKAGQVLWLGRVVVTCNLDPESIRLLPNVELSLLDKISLFKCAKTNKKFPAAEKIDEILAEELPSLCSYLINWEIPEKCKGDTRFGVSSYHESSLYHSALQTSPSFSFLELLVDFLDEYDKAGCEDNCWEGTATQLIADMMVDARIGGIAAKYTPTHVANLLGQLKARGFDLRRKRGAKQRVWRIPFNIMDTCKE